MISGWDFRLDVGMITAKPKMDRGRQLGWFLPAGICFFLVVVTLAIYWPVVNCGFIQLDDPDYFAGNSHVQAGLNMANVAWAFTTGFASNWHPLTWLSLMLDAQLFGQGPYGPHLVNLLLHTTNTVVLFFLLRRLTAATWKSALVATLFALHPLHVESVAWVAERKDVLSAFFGFISVWTYARYARERFDSSRPRYLTPGYFISWFFFALSLMSKPMLVTLPFMLLLLDYWPLQRFKIPVAKSEFTKLILEKIPFLVLSLLSSVVTFVVQQHGGAVQVSDKFSVSERIANAFVSYGRYLGKAFWPVSLANPYPHPNTWPEALVVFTVAVFVLSCVVAVVLVRKYPFGFVGWFWFAGMLVPTIGLVQVGGASMADRYTYLPLIGIFIILAWVLGGVCMRWRGAQTAVIVVTALSIILCARQTRLQIGYWHDTRTLFSHALAVMNNDCAECNSLGIWMASHGEPGLALECYNRAQQLDPNNAIVLYNLGNSLFKARQNDVAIDCYRRALQLAPATGELLSNLGSALVIKKQYAEAITNLEMSLKLKPDSVGAHNNLATALYKEHRYSESAEHFQEALRYLPDSYDRTDMIVKAQIYSNLGDALTQQGKTPEARQSYHQALELQPDNMKFKAKLEALGMP
ncbi:MAG: tetratricopeptide repeat protein [Verrucomicrobia bacterium]|nr:tetratricopeptide repeat protein [Verrucomicrobiota bacterium]